jgi:hypothetical protein
MEIHQERLKRIIFKVNLIVFHSLIAQDIIFIISLDLRFSLFFKEFIPSFYSHQSKE